MNKVVDPEVGIPITDMELVDDINIDKGHVTVTFHFTTPMCPPVFAFKIAMDIKNLVSALDGVEKVTVTIKNHVMADKINTEVNKA